MTTDTRTVGLSVLFTVRSKLWKESSLPDELESRESELETRTRDDNIRTREELVSSKEIN
jgi:hypothetical protein